MTSVIVGTADTVIDPRAAKAHAWSSGYSRGLAGGSLDNRFAAEDLQAEYTKGHAIGARHRDEIREATS